MRGVPGNATPHFFQHPSTVSALRADPPSPTRGEGKKQPLLHRACGHAHDQIALQGDADDG
ncbi:MAG: hypothetical protein EOR48_16810 [Mesorhizobium sp.]|nr:MAG: hypothetical protein EOR48_16810 [Mesorhizobium sp.]TIP47223.1 MAG: hypothetical protein E5X62_07055 [Mesorhizobium sp.]